MSIAVHVPPDFKDLIGATPTPPSPAELHLLEKLNGGPLELSPSPEGIQARVRAEGGLQGHSLYLGVGDDLYPKLSGEVQSDSAEARALGLAVRDFFLYR